MAESMVSGFWPLWLGQHHRHAQTHPQITCRGLNPSVPELWLTSRLRLEQDLCAPARGRRGPGSAETRNPMSRLSPATDGVVHEEAPVVGRSRDGTPTRASLARDSWPPPPRQIEERSIAETLWPDHPNLAFLSMTKRRSPRKRRVTRTGLSSVRQCLGVQSEERKISGGGGAIGNRNRGCGSRTGAYAKGRRCWGHRRRWFRIRDNTTPRPATIAKGVIHLVVRGYTQRCRAQR